MRPRADFIGRSATPERPPQREIPDRALTSQDPGVHGEEELGKVIGHYKLLEKVGEGGFGAVYVAEQREPVKRRVALKIIKLGMDTRQVVARFEAERQALALMDHPNIAKVLDAGATKAGPPYFVMELVKGMPITKYCEQEGTETTERLNLFIQVCQAIQHAHQKGIIHRDIKPSNILVTLHDGVPVPKVIDFGIAKATQGELTDKTVYTQLHLFIGTPAYMSPEQAEMSGLDVDTRSDIYSLGVLLYELLTGSTPFDTKELLQSGLDEMRKIIREREPMRPSTRLTAGGRGQKSEVRGQPWREVSGDLDWIVMKCLEKHRTRRYETASSLARDVENHLKNEPVVARPPTAAYRLQKLVRRHRTASVAVALVTLAVLLGGVVSTWALFRERAAREQANQRLHAALVFVDQVLGRVAPEFAKIAGATTGQERLGQAGLDFAKELRAGGGDAPQVRASMARLLVYLSEAHGNPGEANTVGDYEGGLRRAEEAVALLSPDPPHPNDAENLQLLVRAKFSMAVCLWGLARYDEELVRLREIDPLLVQLERFAELAPWVRSLRMSTLGSLGLVTAAAGQPKEAIERYLQPLLNGDWARSVTTNSSEFELEALANAQGSLALAHEFLNEFDAMIQAAGEAIRISELLARRFPQNARHPAFAAGLQAQQGLGMIRTGRTADGLAALANSRETIETLVSKDPASDHFRVWRIIIVANQARAFAAWSFKTSAPFPERRERLVQAEAYLAAAETFLRASRSKAPELILGPARAEVAAAKAKRQDTSASSGKPFSQALEP